MSNSDIAINNLRRIPAFHEFAHREMVCDPEFYVQEAERGTGILQILSAAVVEIGGDGV